MFNNILKYCAHFLKIEKDSSIGNNLYNFLKKYLQVCLIVAQAWATMRHVMGHSETR